MGGPGGPRTARTLLRSGREPKMRHPGIEPGPPRWQRGIITTRLMTLDSWHKRGQGGLEPPTSRTRSENHTSRPLALRTMGDSPRRPKNTRARDRTGDLLRVRQSS